GGGPDRVGGVLRQRGAEEVERVEGALGVLAQRLPFDGVNVELVRRGSRPGQEQRQQQGRGATEGLSHECHSRESLFSGRPRGGALRAAPRAAAKRWSRPTQR